MRKLFVIVIGLFLLSGCADFSQRVENAANLALRDYDRVKSPPPTGQCSLSPINWSGERVGLKLVLLGDMYRMFSEDMRDHVMGQFGSQLRQRGASVVDLPSAKYEMRIRPLIQYDLVFFQITVLDREKRPVAYNLAQHRLETPWVRLTERVKGELIETMALNAFVRLCAGPPQWPW